MIIRSFTKSFFNPKESNVKIAVGRAGNVIGGGDWALHRIIPDCVNAWDKKEKVQIRKLDATRLATCTRAFKWLSISNEVKARI